MGTMRPNKYDVTTVYRLCQDFVPPDAFEEFHSLYEEVGVPEQREGRYRVVIAGALCDKKQVCFMAYTTNKFVGITKGGKVLASLPYPQIVTISNDGVSQGRLKLTFFIEEAQMYLCFNERWRLVTSKKLQESCYFYDSIVGGYFRYQSALDEKKFIGFKSSGRPVNYLNVTRVINERAFNLQKLDPSSLERFAKRDQAVKFQTRHQNHHNIPNSRNNNNNRISSTGNNVRKRGPNKRQKKLASNKKQLNGNGRKGMQKDKRKDSGNRNSTILLPVVYRTSDQRRAIIVQSNKAQLTATNPLPQRDIQFNNNYLDYSNDGDYTKLDIPVEKKNSSHLKLNSSIIVTNYSNNSDNNNNKENSNFETNSLLTIPKIRHSHGKHHQRHRLNGNNENLYL